VRALTGREHPVAGSAVLAWRLAPLPSLASFAPGPLVSNPCLGAAQPRLSLVAEPSGSGSPLCQGAVAGTGVGSFSSPGSDCSEVLAMGIRSAALD
jgi:hypothetical protein